MSLAKMKDDLANVRAALKSSDDLFEQLAAPIRASCMDEPAKGQLLAKIWDEHVEPNRRPLLKLERELKRKLKESE
jgi:hypothetical protein